MLNQSLVNEYEKEKIRLKSIISIGKSLDRENYDDDLWVSFKRELRRSKFLIEKQGVPMVDIRKKRIELCNSIINLSIQVAEDNDFKWIEDDKGYRVLSRRNRGYYHYVGSNKEVSIPWLISGDAITSYYNMFNGTDVNRVISTNHYITNMDSMFKNNSAKSISLNLFTTVNVVDMKFMFCNSMATFIDLSSFNTRNLVDTFSMFYGSKAKELDFSSFNTSKISNTGCMFRGSQLEQVYVKTETDLQKLKSSTYKPSGLLFKVI